MGAPGVDQFGVSLTRGAALRNSQRMVRAHSGSGDATEFREAPRQRGLFASRAYKESIVRPSAFSHLHLGTNLKSPGDPRLSFTQTPAR